MQKYLNDYFLTYDAYNYEIIMIHRTGNFKCRGIFLFFVSCKYTEFYETFDKNDNII